MSLPCPSNLPLILLLSCHCKTYSSKTLIRASSGSASEAERKTRPRNTPGYQHQVTEIQGQHLSELPQIDFSPFWFLKAPVSHNLSHYFFPPQGKQESAITCLEQMGIDDVSNLLKINHQH